ncbi:MAG: hypothetical protein ACOYXM_12330 [Actinomycetota bacterium]
MTATEDMRWSRLITEHRENPGLSEERSPSRRSTPTVAKRAVLMVAASAAIYISWTVLAILATARSGVVNCVTAIAEGDRTFEGAPINPGGPISARMGWLPPGTVCMVTLDDGSSVSFRP